MANISKDEMKGKLNEVYQYLVSYTESHGYPPSVRDICQDLHIKSTATAYSYLEKLKDRGLIQKDSSRNRALMLTGRRTGVKNVTLLGHVQAGQPIMAVENAEETYPLPADLFSGDTLFMLNVQGESMCEAGIYDGDKIVVKQQPYARNGEIVVAMIDGEVTVKRFYKKTDHIVLHPENSTMQDIVVPDCDILGVVTGLIRSY
ncbi:MAG: transcriptional repressor LexA [Clostridia bacterium]|nr:transcriptional repressor LexA [Clostridia bacterium]